MKLLNSQKDTLFDIILSIGLSPTQFKFEEVNGILNYHAPTTKLNFINSEYYFLFETGNDGLSSHYSIFCPGQNIYCESQYPGSWENQLKFVILWLNNLIREINTPNKWDRLNKEISLIKTNFGNDENKFSVSEYEDLIKKIRELKKSINSIELLPEQISAINIKLDNLQEFAKEMNKFDWKSLFIGTMISIVIQLSVTPENAKLLWLFIKNIFNNLIIQ